MAPIGIPFVVVCANQPTLIVVYRQNSYDGNYGDESDPGPYPIPLNAPIEGNGTGDRKEDFTIGLVAGCVGGLLLALLPTVIMPAVGRR